MMKRLVRTALLTVLLPLVPPLQAQEEGEEDAPQVEAAPKHEAAAAARNKGYSTEEAPEAVTGPVDSVAPSMSPVSGGSFALPQQRVLGTPGRRTVASGGGRASSSGAGISCDKSDPPLMRVIREARPNLLRDTNKIEKYALGPNEALSVEFIAQKSGWGGFSTNGTTEAREVPHMVNVSETPCDFDVAKTFAGSSWGGVTRSGKPNPCYDFGPVGPGISIVPEGQALAPGANRSSVCFVKPGRTYYFNIRAFVPDPSRDKCAEDARSMGPDLKCGGLWQFIGAEVPVGGGKK